MMDLTEAREQIANADRQMARLFEDRMEAVRAVAEYKKARGLPIEDKAQEAKKLAEGGSLLKQSGLQPYYMQFLQSTMDISKRFQFDIIRDHDDRTTRMDLGPASYDIHRSAGKGKGLRQRPCLPPGKA